MFKPRVPGQVRVFVCGPTVYALSHIGHARTYIFFDFFAKYLASRKHRVFYLQNITDIDDKIIQRAKERNENPLRIAREMEKEYRKDMKALGVSGVTKYARATEHIKEIISQVERLLKKGYAYKTSDGIYYNIKKFKKYGKLSGRTTEQAEDATSRVDESMRKRNKGDFALWKMSKAGEPSWPSPFGKGRPGWHIEDTAITEKYFGPQYDIHGGACDLLFPHHEAEVAQMEAISGKYPLVRYWMHTGFLTVRGEKMAKSLGNFITIRDFLKKYSPRTLRLLALKSHYRSPIDYSEKVAAQTEKELERIDEFVTKIKDLRLKIKGVNTNEKIIKDIRQSFYTALEDDLNTPQAMAGIFDLARQGNLLLAKNKMSSKDAKDMLEFLKEIDGFLRFIFWEKQKPEKIPVQVMRLANERETYRKEKNWQKADELRNKIWGIGYHIEDTAQGPKIKIK